MWPIKQLCLQHLWALPNNLKHNEASFSKNSLCFQLLKCLNFEIWQFMCQWSDRWTKIITSTLAAHACGWADNTRIFMVWVQTCPYERDYHIFMWSHSSTITKTSSKPTLNNLPPWVCHWSLILTSFVPRGALRALRRKGQLHAHIPTPNEHHWCQTLGAMRFIEIVVTYCESKGTGS